MIFVHCYEKKILFKLFHFSLHFSINCFSVLSRKDTYDVNQYFPIYLSFDSVKDHVSEIFSIFQQSEYESWHFCIEFYTFFLHYIYFFYFDKIRIFEKFFVCLDKIFGAFNVKHFHINLSKLNVSFQSLENIVFDGYLHVILFRNDSLKKLASKIVLSYT